MFIRQLIYRSTATRRLGDDELRELVAQSRRRNAHRAITGFLYYADQQYLHVLEGESRAVELLHGAIARDPRHTDLVTMFDAPASERLFPNWSMGCSCLAPDALTRLAGYLDPKLRSALLPTCDAQAVVMDLLHEFVEDQNLPIGHYRAEYPPRVPGGLSPLAGLR